MSTNQRLSIFSVLLILLVTTMSFSIKEHLADARFHAQNVNILIKGTSTLHDWEMKSNQGNMEVLLSLASNDKIAAVTGLSFSTPAESLKSEHTMMDNNAYKALKTSAAKNITYSLSSATVSQLDANTYQIKSLGKLSIAGNSRETDVLAIAKYNAADKSFTISGSKKIKMTEYGVKPPTVMMGTIKTGDDLTISFNTKIVR